MKPARAIILLIIVTATLPAQEIRRTVSAPQPRVRLDPRTQTAIPEPKKEEKKDSPNTALVMSPFIVKSTPEPYEINEPNQEQARLPTGPFSLVEGGWITRKDSNGMHVEVGVWPYRNILWKTDRFKSDTKHVTAEFVRVSW